jgi:multiple sugar transport system substrate-binding protein
MTLRIALVGGPMYDHIEALFAPGEVEIVVKADHPTLNRAVASMLAAGERIDVLATHSKYAPSQATWLHPLDALLPIATVSALAPAAVALCQFYGQLLCVPRLIDVRLAWSRADQVQTPPTTWAELALSDTVFGYTGRESGAFGLFFELVTGAGGSLFDPEVRPTMDTPQAREALALMAHLAQRAPRELPDWHYDDVDRALLEGRIQMSAAWPGGWSAIARSTLALVPSLYPSGPVRRVSYSGCHGWAIPRTCGDLPGAIALVERLIGEEAQALDASFGSICAHSAALGAVVPTNRIDAQRLHLTQETIANLMITYPPLASFPRIEDGGAAAINAVLRGELSPGQAAAQIQALALEALDAGAN